MRRAALFLLAALGTAAGGDHIADPNNNGWYMYFGDHPVAGSRWGIHLEGQWRRASLGLQWQQLLLRPGVNFQLRKDLMLTGGICYTQTYPYGDYPVRSTSPEYRYFEQALWTRRVGKLDWQSRFRLEQRNIGQMVQSPGGGFHRDSWRYENRFRYMLRTSVPLPISDRKLYYLGLYDEIFLNFGHNVGANHFDQNRAYIALGRNMGHQTRIEVGFMEQTLQHRDGRVFEHNHTLQVAVFSKLPFGN